MFDGHFSEQRILSLNIMYIHYQIIWFEDCAQLKFLISLLVIYIFKLCFSINTEQNNSSFGTKQYYDITVSTIDWLGDGNICIFLSNNSCVCALKYIACAIHCLGFKDIHVHTYNPGN